MSTVGNLIDNLKKLGYEVSYFDSKKEAAEYLNSKIDGKTVGFGGSVTLSEMKLYEALESHNDVYWHDRLKNGMSMAETRKVAANSSVYISSVNAISECGEIVNIDNTGNRVAAISYGPEYVYLVFGINKIAKTLNEALDRARNIAAPLNAKRLNKKTPCAIKADKCYNCQSEDRICRNISILVKKPTGAKYEIIIINENLGY